MGGYNGNAEINGQERGNGSGTGDIVLLSLLYILAAFITSPSLSWNLPNVLYIRGIYKPFYL